MRGPSGGFIHIPKRNSRLELQSLLDQFEHIRDARDKYSQRDRPLYPEDSVVPFKSHQEQAEDEKRGSILQQLEVERDELMSPKLNVSLSARSPAGQ